jgi:hypothetical protein
MSWLIGVAVALGICWVGEYAERRMKVQWKAEQREKQK